MYRFKSWSLLLPFCAFFNGKIYFTSSCSDLKSKEKPSWSAGQFPQRTSTTKHQAHAAHSVPPYAHLPPRTREQSSLWLPPQPILTLCKALPACTRAQVGTWYLSPWLQQKRCSQLARRRVSCWLSTSVCSSSAGQDARQQQDLGGGVGGTVHEADTWPMGWILWILEQSLGWMQHCNLEGVEQHRGHFLLFLWALIPWKFLGKCT